MARTRFAAVSLNKYLDCLASHAPTPGGGSAAAVAGALACALISMAAHFTISRIKRQPNYKKLKS